MPASGDTMATSCPVSRLMSVDLPAFVRPKIDIWIRSDVGVVAMALESKVTLAVDDGLEVTLRNLTHLLRRDDRCLTGNHLLAEKLHLW